MLNKSSQRNRLHIVCFRLYEMQKQAKNLSMVVEVRIMVAHGGGQVLIGSEDKGGSEQLLFSFFIWELVTWDGQL